MAGQKTQALTHLEGWDVEALPPTRLKGGIPTDADFFGIPRDGFQVLDTTNGLLWRRMGGLWVAPGAGCRLSNSATQSIASGVATVATFDTEGWNDGGLFHSTSSNTSRISAPVTGRYLVGGRVAWPASGAGIYLTQLWVNRTTAYPMDQRNFTGNSQNISGNEPLSLNAGDFVEFLLTQTSGGALLATCEFWAFMAG